MKIIFALLIISLTFNSFSQNDVFFNDYRSYTNIKVGVYVVKSTLQEYINLELPFIENNSKEIDLNSSSQFIKIAETPVILFDNHDVDKRKPIGKIINTTQVKIDSTFFNQIYRDFSKPFSISFNVWNRIIINEKAYYTDYDIHDSSLSETIEELNQKVLIIGQNTGYDYAYHLGYPEYYFLLFLNENNEVIYESQILDIVFGDEFAMKEDFLITKWNDKTRNFEITLFNQHVLEKKEINVYWNGNKMKIE